MPAFLAGAFSLVTDKYNYLTVGRVENQMKAILIDPWKRSLETIDVKSGYGPEAFQQLHELVGEDSLDFAYIGQGESVAVGGHSALRKLPAFFIAGYSWPLYGRGVVLGYHKDGCERATRLSVDKLSKMIEFP